VIPLNFLGCGDSYNFYYSKVVKKSRCVSRNRNITFIINNLCWSGRRDSNPRPSAPKTDRIAYGNLSKLSGYKCF
jgi:hypothetical protein